MRSKGAKRRMRLGRQRVSAHAIEHSDADSLTHAEDKAANDEIMKARAQEEEFTDTFKMGRRVIVLSELGRFPQRHGPNMCWIRAEEDFKMVSGPEYASFLKQESSKRRRYRPSPQSKPVLIGKSSALDEYILTFLPCHSIFVRTLPLDTQYQLLSMLAQACARSIQSKTGWIVAGISLHNDTDGLHVDYMMTRYSEPQPPMHGTRQRVPACRLLGTQRGLRRVGPRVVSFFRYAGDHHKGSVTPGLSEEACWKYRRHLKEYGTRPMDVLLALDLDREIRRRFEGNPDFEAIRTEWYQCRDRLTRGDRLEKFLQLLRKAAPSKDAPALLAIEGLFAHFASDGFRAVEGALEELKEAHTKPLASAMQALLARQSVDSERHKELEMCKAELACKSHAVERLMADKTALQGALDSSSQSLTTANAAYAAAQEQIGTLVASQREACEKNQSLLARISALQEDKHSVESQLRAQLESTVAETARVDQRVTRLQSALDEAKAALQVAHQDLAKKEERLAKGHRLYCDLKKQKTLAAEENVSLKNRCILVERGQARLRAESDAANRAREENEGLLKQARLELELKHARCLDYEAWVKQLVVECEGLKAALACEQKGRIEAEFKLDKCRKELADVPELKFARMNYNNLEKRATSLEEQNQRLVERLRDASRASEQAATNNKAEICLLQSRIRDLEVTLRAAPTQAEAWGRNGEDVARQRDLRGNGGERSNIERSIGIKTQQIDATDPAPPITPRYNSQRENFPQR